MTTSTSDQEPAKTDEPATAEAASAPEPAAKSPGQNAICSAPESSITDAEQQLCPAVVQTSSHVTVKECADTVDLVIGKAEQLIACPGSCGWLMHQNHMTKLSQHGSGASVGPG